MSLAKPRFAAICPKCNLREFLDSAEAREQWRCPEHDVGVVQLNNQYFGDATEHDGQVCEVRRELAIEPGRADS